MCVLVDGSAKLRLFTAGSNFGTSSVSGFAEVGVLFIFVHRHVSQPLIGVCESDVYLLLGDG